MASKLYARFYAIIAQIPAGNVATYGQIAALAGYPGYARQVGYALHQTPPGLEIPWHRVINAKGQISLKSLPPYDNIQQVLLEAEGVKFNPSGAISLKKYQWNPAADV